MKLELAARNALANALVTTLDAGAGTSVAKFQNTAQNATYATLNLLDPSFGSASSGVISISGSPVDSTAASGTTTRCGFYDGDANLIFTLGVSDSNTPDLKISNSQIFTNDKVQITGLDITVPAGTPVTA